MILLKYFLFVWIITLSFGLGLSLALPILQHPNAETILLTLLSITAVASGFFLGKLIHLKHQNHTSIKFFHYRFLTITILVLSAIGFVSYWRYWQSEGITFGDLASFFYDMNVIISQSENEFGGILGRLYLLPIIGVIWVQFLRSKELISKNMGLILSIIFLLMLISPRRAFLFYAILSWGSSYIIFNKIPFFSSKSARLLWVTLLLLATFSFTQTLLGKADDTAFITAIIHIYHYTYGSLVVMERLMQTHHFDDVFVTFNVIFRLVNAILDTHFKVDLSIPFIYVPEMLNTVPFNYYFIKDLGIPGSILVSLFVGFVACLSIRIYYQTHRFFYGCAGTLFLVGFILSMRENFFISYTFVFLLFIAYTIDFLTRKRFV